MRALAIVPTHNAAGKKDVTGAFLPEAKRFLRHHGVKEFVGLVRFDNRASKAKRRRAVERAIWEHRYDGLLDHVAFFCHGLKNQIQTGHHSRGSVASLAKTIAMRSHTGVRVTLYCCDTARDSDGKRDDDQLPGPGGDGGFADVLRDHLCALGCSGGWVDGHTVTAHTTRAPFVRRFYTDGSKDGGFGGDWIVAPRSPLWSRWRRALWGRVMPKSIRFDFPLMSIADVHAALVK